MGLPVACARRTLDMTHLIGYLLQSKFKYGLKNIEFDEVAEKVFIVDLEANSEESEGGYNKDRVGGIRLEVLPRKCGDTDPVGGACLARSLAWPHERICSKKACKNGF